MVNISGPIIKYTRAPQTGHSMVTSSQGLFDYLIIDLNFDFYF